jgi:raffinose/stachyose/melibiose transport system permease protein
MEFESRSLSRTLIYMALSAAAFAVLLPLIMMVLNSLRSNFEIFTSPIGVPQSLDLSIYPKVFESAGLGRAMLNSSLITGGTIISVCTVTSLAAWVIARKSVPGWLLASLYFLASTTIPVQMYIFPLYFVMAQLGLVNQPLAIIVIYTAIWTPFSLFLLRTYILEIPVELEEAARIDGASEFAIFFKVILPLITPGLLTVALITGLNAWNEFLISITFLQTGEAATVTARFYQLIGRFSNDTQQQMVTATMIAIPVVVFFVLLQRRFIEGISSGAVKG